MPIVFRDFAPAVIKQGQFLVLNEYEEMSETLARANNWIAASGAKVINVETVVLPNLGRLDSSVKGVHWTKVDHLPSWHQVIRVWHDETPPPLPGQR